MRPGRRDWAGLVKPTVPIQQCLVCSGSLMKLLKVVLVFGRAEGTV
jgi:hypothetical protein